MGGQSQRTPGGSADFESCPDGDLAEASASSRDACGVKTTVTFPCLQHKSYRAPPGMQGRYTFIASQSISSSASLHRNSKLTKHYEFQLVVAYVQDQRAHSWLMPRTASGIMSHALLSVAACCDATWLCACAARASTAEHSGPASGAGPAAWLDASRSDISSARAWCMKRQTGCFAAQVPSQVQCSLTASREGSDQ